MNTPQGLNHKCNNQITELAKGWYVTAYKTLFFFFCKKDVYSKTAKSSIKHIKKYKKREKSKNIKEALITKKERDKEQRERNCLQNSKN